MSPVLISLLLIITEDLLTDKPSIFLALLSHRNGYCEPKTALLLKMPSSIFVEHIGNLAVEIFLSTFQLYGINRHLYSKKLIIFPLT